MENLELSPSVFSILSALIEEKVGIHYSLADRDLLQEKASARAMEAGFNSLLDYYYFLRYDSDSQRELAELVEILVVNETYFFREWVSISALVEKFVAPMCARRLPNERKIRIWSAACSTGEEPLSLAMLLDDRNLLDQVEIVASDISPRVLAKAQSGRFSKRSVRGMRDDRLLAKYLTPNENGYSVAPNLIAAIQWRQQNLLMLQENGDEALAGKPFDIVICRNVLIYFSDVTVRTVLASLGRALVPDGVLLVGVSESLYRFGSDFDGEEHGGAFFYRKVKPQ